jgi:hypothetical protein
MTCSSKAVILYFRDATSSLESSSSSSTSSLENDTNGQSIEGIHGRGEDEQELWNKSEGEGDELSDFKGREPLFLLRILPFHNMNIDLSTGRIQQEKIESKRAQGSAGWPRSVAGQRHFAPKNYGIFPKFPYKLLNSLLPLILEIWKENFEKGKS